MNSVPVKCLFDNRNLFPFLLFALRLHTRSTLSRSFGPNRSVHSPVSTHSPLRALARRRTRSLPPRSPHSDTSLVPILHRSASTCLFATVKYIPLNWFLLFRSFIASIVDCLPLRSRPTLLSLFSRTRPSLRPAADCALRFSR